MRRQGLVIACATLCSCFSPRVGPDADVSGSDTDASTGATMLTGVDASSGDDTETTAVDPDTTVGSTDTESETTVGDDPPVFESFTLNGSTRPAEVGEGGTITLEAEATDDVGVVSVEFFDGDASLGVVEDPPYELEVLVSSADSGSHTYRAVATDTVGQTGDSEEVTLSINIVGGEIEFLREDLFRGTDALALLNGGIDAGMDDRVFVSGILAGGGNSRVLGFNRDLSLLWSQTYPEQTPGSPITIGDALFVGGPTPTRSRSCIGRSRPTAA